MGLWRAIKRKINENRLAQERYKLPWSQLTKEQKNEIIRDVENAFLEGDRKIAFSRSAEGVSNRPYWKGRAGKEKRQEGGRGGTERRVRPHASSEDSERDHIPVDGKNSHK